VLLGGYLGGWLAAGEAWGLRLDAQALQEKGGSLGCGVVAVLPEHRCGVVEASRILGYLADQSARQCGPCVFGLRAIAEATRRLAAGASRADDLVRLRRWSGEIAGRGACGHPDGAGGFLRSALAVFGDEVALHAERRSCTAGVASGAA
jgi:NADH:ubiquinone oxidoreductase subunit F (NADH-binding)